MQNGIFVDGSGTKRWYVDDLKHREDGPAIEYADGAKEWWLNGNLHREDGPAIEWPDGSKHWYKNGKLHREDGPAAEYADGTRSWYRNGKLHREDGPAVEGEDGSKHWYLNGIAHREDGPAVISGDGKTKEWYYKGICTGIGESPDQTLLSRLTGDLILNGCIVDARKVKKWYQNGELHREDGPAIEFEQGVYRWYFRGEDLGDDDFSFWELWEKLTDEQRNNSNLLRWLPS